MFKIVVMSDIYFGIEECTIGLPPNGSSSAKQKSKKDNVDVLIKFFKQEGINEIYLLGDIFDTFFSNFHNTIKASEYFFESLVQVVKKITFIPGNHDHIFWLQHVYMDQVINKVKIMPIVLTPDFKFTGYLYNKKETFFRNIFRNPDYLAVTYPLMVKEINGKSYLFTHGHFIEGTDLIDKLYSLTVGKILDQILKVDHKNIDQLEIVSSPLYITASLLGQIERGRSALKDKKNIFTKFPWGKCDIDSIKREIKTFLNYAGQSGANWTSEVLDYFLFGHTHFAGINHYKYEFNRKLISINTGSWAERESGDILGEFVIINPKLPHPRLYCLSKHREIKQHDDSDQLDNNIIPNLGWRIFSRRS